MTFPRTPRPLKWCPMVIKCREGFPTCPSCRGVPGKDNRAALFEEMLECLTAIRDYYKKNYDDPELGGYMYDELDQLIARCEARS